MLKYLNVSQFAIIENVEVTFENGMNVLTGETGAGKSLLIDAIGLLLGERASQEVIRSGEDYAEITAVFEPLNDSVKATLESLDIPFEDDELLIKRRIQRNSGNLIKVNRETITLADLKVITKNLADIHTQHDTKRLINPDTYLSLIDSFDDSIQSYLTDYQAKRKVYSDHYKAYQSLKDDKDAMLEKLDLLKFQSEELHNHNLEANELQTIEERLQTLQNFDEIYQAVKQSYDLLETSNATANIYEAADELSRVETYDETYESLKQRIESAYYELDDAKSTLSNLLESLDFDPNELETLESRKHTLDTLRRKYNREIDELIEYHEQINAEIVSYDNYDESLDKAEKNLKTAYDDVLKSALTLRNHRKKIAKTIENTLQGELKDLELKSAEFEVSFSDERPSHYSDIKFFGKEGIDTIDFLLTTNAGEAKKPLKKIASGGELSRIMLALKTLLVFKDSLNLMIFDEIDTGVSGYVASQVAKKMHAIAAEVQVLAITHLPQVAAKADHHYYIFKEEHTGRVKTSVKKLDHDHRVKSLAEMISSDTVSQSALKSAKELLK